MRVPVQDIKGESRSTDCQAQTRLKNDSLFLKVAHDVPAFPHKLYDTLFYWTFVQYLYPVAIKKATHSFKILTCAAKKEFQKEKQSTLTLRGKKVKLCRIILE